MNFILNKLQCIYNKISPFLLSWWFTMLWQSFSSLELRYFILEMGFSFGKYPPFQRSSTDDMLVNHKMFTRWGKVTDMALHKPKSLGLPLENATSDQIIIFTLMWHVQGTVVASFSISTMMKKYWSVFKDGSKVVNPNIHLSTMAPFLCSSAFTCLLIILKISW